MKRKAEVEGSSTIRYLKRRVPLKKKKTRSVNYIVQAPLRQPLLFRPYRALGFVTEPLPFSLIIHNTNTFIVTSIGKSFQCYNSDHLKLKFVGPTLDHKIRVLTADRSNRIFAACRNLIYVHKRQVRLGVFSGHNKRITHLLRIGDLLISIDEGGTLIIWEVTTASIIGTINLPDTLHVTALLHPPTYLNKILIGSEEGTLQLWNIKTLSLIYSFNKFKSPITCLQEAPAVDIVAIGFANGQIIIQNIKTDVQLCSFSLKSCPVSCLSFRLDGEPILAAGTPTGKIVVFDLEEKKILLSLEQAHSRVVSIQFLPSQPILVSSGADNCLKMWIFDGAKDDSGARLLRSRSGHSGPPSGIQFYGESGSDILSCGGTTADSTLRNTCLFADHRNKELSQGLKYRQANKINFHKHRDVLPPISHFDSSQLRQNEWDNVLTCHESWSYAYTWNYAKGGLGRYRFKTTDPKFPKSPITAVAISSCGNFGYIGSESGWIDKFNLQSGLHRGCCGLRTKDAVLQFNSMLCTVQSLAVDAFNKILVSAFLDGSMIFWDATNMKLKKQLKLSMPLSFLRIHKESSLVALVCDDFVIRLYDVETHRLVRRFIGHTCKINDAVFNADGRWLISASMDKTIRVWDVPSSRQVYWFQVPVPARGIAISPTNEYLATTHINNKGIFLWTNEGHFSNVYLKVSDKPQMVDLPSIKHEEVDQTEELKDSENLENGVPSSSRDQESDIQIIDGDAAMKEVQDNPQQESDDEDEDEEEAVGDGELGSDVERERAQEREEEEKKMIEEEKEKREREERAQEKEQDLCKGLISFSSLPRPTWLSAINLETIKARNKPKKGLEKKKAAPFILATTQSAQPKFILADNQKQEILPDSSHLIGLSKIICSPFILLLRTAHSSPKPDYGSVVEALSKMSATALDFEVRTMNVEQFAADKKEDSELSDDDDLLSFLDMLLESIPSNSNYELLQAVLNMILHIHGDVLLRRPELTSRVEKLRELSRYSWVHVQSLFHKSLCLLNHFTGVHL